ncbi:MAG: LytTR family DNA-binding domain-containing protein [Bacteroidales bacterium]|jgi:two-component system LytT family response regulator|nr:LytTR family DNA-binding domain-containing protein [Bacteroidales bacterium]
METIKALIIEDEKPARDLLNNYISNHQQIEVIGEIDNGFDAVKLINEHNPDLIFLDIQIPKLTGLEVLELVENMPCVIFTTAYNEYAIKAFEINAVDYLLKPYSRKRFAEAIEKASVRLAKGEKGENEKKLLETTNATEEEFLQRVVIKDRSKINVVATTEIKYIKAEDDYVMIHSEKGNFLKQKTMKFFESSLDPKQFVRIHRSYIVNINIISSLQLYEKDSYVVKTTDGDTLKVSKTGLKKIKQQLDM